jgi:hypothetical protein
MNVDKTNYMVMSQDQNAGRNHNIKIHNSSFESVEELRYLEKTSHTKFLFGEKFRTD